MMATEFEKGSIVQFNRVGQHFVKAKAQPMRGLAECFAGVDYCVVETKVQGSHLFLGFKLADGEDIVWISSALFCSS